jgi:hypothetical protein
MTSTPPSALSSDQPSVSSVKVSGLLFVFLRKKAPSVPACCSTDRLRKEELALKALVLFMPAWSAMGRGTEGAPPGVWWLTPWQNWQQVEEAANCRPDEVDDRSIWRENWEIISQMLDLLFSPVFLHVQAWRHTQQQSSGH